MGSLMVLIISTDPAHSLGDALSEPLHRQQKHRQKDDEEKEEAAEDEERCQLWYWWYEEKTKVQVRLVSRGFPLRLNCADNLFAVEVDPEEALQELRESLKVLAQETNASLEIWLDSLGLWAAKRLKLDLRYGFEEGVSGGARASKPAASPPPGVDEIAAIAKAITETEGFDVVVFDTAPTGHTLRLLEVPTFLIGFIDRALSVRKSIGGPEGTAKPTTDLRRITALTGRLAQARLQCRALESELAGEAPLAAALGRLAAAQRRLEEAEAAVPQDGSPADVDWLSSDAVGSTEEPELEELCLSLEMARRDRNRTSDRGLELSREQVTESVRA
ncbi:putative arsenical pump-driving ATPase [Symbiodinium microadriaticum]|uniref:Putative arsenical pump-driving ATPase n=1 Tax=Symbiodinium microadriaticum TaxID=2951 RepID=A0A1Q9DQ77_SYMMI|nr:putative arsenical pump-driving ATPase [Symbiodinium microadriaticum]